MAYILRNVNTGETVVMGVNNKYTLGRSRINSVLLKDKSCSHKHAVIQIKKGYPTILDVGSKRGTYINKCKIEKETKLKTGDVIRFGLKNCIWSFIKTNFKTAVDDSVSDNMKTLLQNTLTALSVKQVRYYMQVCTHYTTEVITLDILKYTKILYAIVDQKPIVKPVFWIRMFKNIKKAVELPNQYRYRPKIESIIKNKGVRNIIPKKRRDNLFKDKICIFPNEALEKQMKDIICKCGGRTTQYNQKVNFAETLVKERKFSEAIIISGEPKDNNSSLRIPYFINKLRQCKKAVQELSENDVYIIILKGYLDNPTVQKSQKNGKKNKSGSAMVASDKPGTSKSLENVHNIKKNSFKAKPVNSHSRTPIKKKVKLSAVSEKDDDGFNTCLDMSSDSDREKAVKGPSVPENNNQHPLPLAIISDDSEPEDRLKLKENDKRSIQGIQTLEKKNAGTSLKAVNQWINSLKKKSATVSSTKVKKSTQATNVMADKEKFNTNLDMTSDDTGDEQVKILPKFDNKGPRKLNTVHLKTEEIPKQTIVKATHNLDDSCCTKVKGVSKKRSISSTKPKASRKSAYDSPEIQRKTMKINPFAMSRTARNTSKPENDPDLPPDPKRLKEMFQDVDFETF